MFAACKTRWKALGFSFVEDEATAKLMDILLFGPLLLTTGVVAKQLPKSLRVTLILSGGFVIVWNAVGYLRKRPDLMFETPVFTEAARNSGKGFARLSQVERELKDSA